MKYYKLLFLFIPFLSFSQNNMEIYVDNITTIDEAKAFIKTHKTNFKGKIITFNKEKHKTRLASELFEKAKGGKKVIKTEKGKTIYKIIDKKQIIHYKVSIILFDNEKTSISEINSLRSFILKGIKNKEHKFENLARVYSAHPTAKTGGDLGWLKKGTFSNRFEKVVLDKHVGQVFSFDEHRQKKYYIIMKTQDSKQIEEITILKIEQK